jgi:hypothetical protein
MSRGTSGQVARDAVADLSVSADHDHRRTYQRSGKPAQADHKRRIIFRRAKTSVVLACISSA